MGFNFLLKFIYSEKATKFCEIFTLLLSYVVPVKGKVNVSQNFVAFSEYRGFSPYATFGTWQKVALAKNRISHVCTQ